MATQNTDPEGSESIPRAGRRSSLSTQIGLLYVLLALINILFFSVMIFENQTELLNKNFNFEYRSFVNNILREMGQIELGPQKDEAYEALQKVLAVNKIGSYTVFDADGKILFREPNPPKAGEAVTADIRRKSLELSIETAVFQTPYKLIPNSENFTVDFFLPISGKDKARYFLYTLLSIEQIKQRLFGLYVQIGLAVGWGVIFHLLFALFVYRVIFRRVGRLTEISRKLEEGDLKARADWTFKRNDELDELGAAFNKMAGRTEETIETITRLNTEIQNELEIGKDVQQLFLPDPKILEEYHVAVHYRPLREVSGDIYNFFQFPKLEGHRGLFFADASGHGVSAALVTTITLMMLDDIVPHTAQPNRVLNQLNDVLSQRLQSSFFATGVFLVFAPGGTLYFCNAGHNPPVVFRPSNGRMTELEKGGPPLGMFEDIEYNAAKVQLLAEDRVLVYSDALVESKSGSGEMFGIDRVREILAANMTKSPQEIVDALWTRLDDHTAEFTDDVSIIVLEIP